MKKLFLVASIFVSMSALASGMVGKYSNGQKECDLEVSISDFLGTGRDMLVASTAMNRITEWGANFNVEMSELDKFGICPKKIIIDDGMGPGFGGTRMIQLNVEQTFCEVSSFTLVLGQDFSHPRDVLKCKGMKKTP